jgi:hypothetical protein
MIVKLPNAKVVTFEYEQTIELIANMPSIIRFFIASLWTSRAPPACSLGVPLGSPLGSQSFTKTQKDLWAPPGMV